MPSSPGGDRPLVALDAQACLGRRTGVGWYATRLIQSLLARGPTCRYELVLAGFRRKPALPFSTGPAVVTVLRSPSPRASWPAGVHRLAFAHRYGWSWPRALAKSGAAVVHGLNFFVPRRGPYRRVATVHDVDFLQYPERQSAANRRLFRTMVTPSLAHLDAIVVPSRAVRDRLCARVAVTADRVHVIPEAPAPEFLAVRDGALVRSFRVRCGLPERFVLCVGTAEPRKNFETAVCAVAGAAAVRDLALVHAGPDGWGGVDLAAVAAHAGIAGRFRRLGYVSEADLPLLYASASALLMPSHDEGFGLPAIEAMASGTPVLCSDRGALPEVTAGAALVLDPDDVGAWTRAIERIAKDASLRRRLAEGGRRRARAWTWTDAARATSGLYRTLAAWSAS